MVSFFIHRGPLVEKSEEIVQHFYFTNKVEANIRNPSFFWLKFLRVKIEIKRIVLNYLV